MERRTRRKSKNARMIKWVVLLWLLVLIAAATLVYLLQIKPAQQRERYPLDYEAQIAAQCRENGLDPYLVASMIYCESHYVPTVESSVGARGLMQLMPQTADWLVWRLKWDDFDQEQLFDPEVNITLGCAYLGFLSQRYGGDRDCMVAAYHGGHGQVDKWLADPRYSSDGKTLSALPEDSDTNHYLKWVLSVYEIYPKLYPNAFD